MEVILLERVAKLGHMGEVVRVRDGFARNFLLKRGKALREGESRILEMIARDAPLGGILEKLVLVVEALLLGCFAPSCFSMRAGSTRITALLRVYPRPTPTLSTAFALGRRQDHAAPP